MVGTEAYDMLVNKQSEKFYCHKCDVNFASNVNKQLTSKSASSEFNQIMSQFKKQSSELKEIRSSISFFAKQYDDLLLKFESHDNDIKVMKKDIEGFKKENASLKSENAELQSIVRNLEADKVKTKVLIKANKSELLPNTTEKVIEIAKTIGVNIEEREIVSCNVVKSYSVEYRGQKFEKSIVMVDFCNDRTRNEVMRNKKKLKETASRNVVIFEALAMRTKHLLDYAMQLKTLGYVSVFAIRGKVYARKERERDPVWLKTKDDVDALLRGAVR